MERGQRAELSELAQHAQQTEVAAEAQKERELRSKDTWIQRLALPAGSGCLGGEPQGVLRYGLGSTKSSPSQVN